MTPTTWIGVDIAKADFVAAQRTQKGFDTQNFPMTRQGFEAFRDWLPEAAELAIVFEATGPYWLRLAHWLDGLQETIPYACINPRQLRDFAKASPERSKTDPIDAALLVHFAETFPPSLGRPKTRNSQRLRALWRHHLELQNLLDRTRDRQEKASADPRLPAELAAGLETLLDCLKHELQTVEHQAQALVRQDTTRQLTCYAGLDPILFESGTSVRKRPHVSKQGNWRLRRALYMAALVGVRFNPVLKTFYQRKLKQGLAKKSALVAAMRKLLHLVYGVLKHQQPFNPDYESLT